MLLTYMSSNQQEQYRQMAAIQMKNILRKAYGIKSDTESHYNEKKQEGE